MRRRSGYLVLLACLALAACGSPSGASGDGGLTVASPSVTDHACPYLTDVSATITVAGGPVEVHYQWILSNGDVVTSAVDFTGTGVQSRDIVEHVDLDNVASLSYRVKLTDVIPYTSPAATISCNPPEAMRALKVSAASSR
jgi:ABC-type glycerol-3-phosphate transport system substrate-binding protein